MFQVDLFMFQVGSFMFQVGLFMFQMNLFKFQVRPFEPEADLLLSQVGVFSPMRRPGGSCTEGRSMKKVLTARGNVVLNFV
jgi:hypothetical protein